MLLRTLVQTTRRSFATTRPLQQQPKATTSAKPEAPVALNDAVAFRQAPGLLGRFLGYAPGIFKAFSGKEPIDAFFSRELLPFARKNGGICRFKFGPFDAYYCASSKIRIHKEEHLLASTKPMSKILGKHMLTSMDVADPKYKALRRLLIRYNTNAYTQKAEATIKDLTAAHIRKHLDQDVELLPFCHTLVKDINSKIPDFFGLSQKGLNDYGADVQNLIDNFLEIVAKKVMPGPNPTKEELSLLSRSAEVMKTIIIDNFEGITSGKRNFTREAYEVITERPFPSSPEGIERDFQADNDVFKSLFSIVSAAGDSTAAALAFAIVETEANPHIKQEVQASLAADQTEKPGRVDVIQQYLLEFMRLHPITLMLFGIVTEPYTATLNGVDVRVPKHVAIVSDQSAANRDPKLYQNPDQPDLANSAEMLSRAGSTMIGRVLSTKNDTNPLWHPVAQDPKAAARTCPARRKGVETQDGPYRVIYSERFGIQVVSGGSTESRPGSNPNEPLATTVRFTEN